MRLPRQTALVDGQRIEFAVQGHGRIGVVLVNGAGGPLEGWHRLWQPLAERTRVLAYNRAGIGRSARPVAAQAGPRLVAELRALMALAELPRPCLLVAHSLGGLIANLYARQHPGEVAGMVLLEATAPEDPPLLAAHAGRLQRLLQSTLDRVWPADPLGEVRQVPATLAALAAAPPFPAIPLRVVTGAAPAMAWATPAQARALRAAHQRGLATLSPHGQQVMAPRSGHFPQFSEPELVLREVLALLDLLEAAAGTREAAPG
ncbi:alpha/beta fold hydrolase [Aquincola tertiaricarbonis]|uniref:alpha/beta fold hydrolase n=1 Tax=Aquincola tertiaricarbonis TaxID=391953 RepID=UPI000695FCB0|nr:alpha/beta fold hydrolase [Aquincola tertiaricarbonis]